MTTAQQQNLSVECTLGSQDGYQDVHDRCRQTRDVPLPHSTGILLVARCRCTCHREARR